MENIDCIRISRPSNEMIDFLERTQHRKKTQMDKICEKYHKLING